MDREVERLIDAYCEAWCEPDAAARRRLLDHVWATGATYTDPRAQLAGLDALVAHIGKVLADRPGSRVIRTSAVDSHHGLARFAWRVVQADGTMLPEGVDFAEVAGDGKLARIVGFFGPLAPPRPG
jgi:alkylated DNA nucleotide flippase Atl1